jgi:hypothetical protein
VPRQKSLLPNTVVDEALRAHNCQHNPAHRLTQGERRLRVRVRRANEHFCVTCALAIIERDIGKLQALAGQLRGAPPPA